MTLIYRPKVDPAQLFPEFRDALDRFLAGSPFVWYVVSGYRSLEEQAKLWDAYRLRGGAKAAPPGSSAHNYGLAVDVVLDVDPDAPGLQPSWDIKLAGWGWLKARSIPHPTLQNGWRFGDWPHIQRFRWRRHIPAAVRWRDAAGFPTV